MTIALTKKANKKRRLFKKVAENRPKLYSQQGVFDTIFALFLSIKKWTPCFILNLWMILLFGI